MGKYRIYVYAISKNESKFVERWYNSMKEADGIYVLDTGSKDDTVSLFQKLGVNVKVEEIKPWRFDVARNKSLALVPRDADICVCTDIDEVFLPGWRLSLEEAWDKDTTQAYYRHNCSFDASGNPTLSFNNNKIHTLDFKWKYPIHEVLIYNGNKEYKSIIINNIVLNHYPDLNKERSSYLPLLEFAVKELPDDGRNFFLLGNEYLRYGKYDECISVLNKFLDMTVNVSSNDRASAMRYIGRSYKEMGNIDKAFYWYNKSIKEKDNLREGYVELGMLFHEQKNYVEAIKYFEKAIEIKHNSLDFINEPFAWDETPYKLLSDCYANIYDFKNGLYYNLIARSINPKDKYLNDMKMWLEKHIIDIYKTN